MSDQTAQPESTHQAGGVSRRGLLRAAGASAAVVGGGGLLEACSSSIKGASSSSSSSSATTGAGTQDILIGFIHPLTGALADFGTSDNWIVSTIQATPQYKNGFKVGGKIYKVNIKSYDTQSDPTRAGQLANQAILSDKVDLLLTSSTPETVNPVATTAEKLGTPLICGNVPWQAWYANLGGNPTPGFTLSSILIIFSKSPLNLFFDISELSQIILTGRSTLALSKSHKASRLCP